MDQGRAKASGTRPPRPTGPKVYIRLANPDDNGLLLSLKQTLDKHPGASEAILVFTDNGEKSALRLPFRVDPSQGLQSELAKLLAADAVVVR
jgi:hypothetical protein